MPFWRSRLPPDSREPSGVSASEISLRTAAARLRRGCLSRAPAYHRGGICCCPFYIISCWFYYNVMQYSHETVEHGMESRSFLCFDRVRHDSPNSQFHCADYTVARRRRRDASRALAREREHKRGPAKLRNPWPAQHVRSLVGREGSRSSRHLRPPSAPASSTRLAGGNSPCLHGLVSGMCGIEEDYESVATLVFFAER